MTPWAAACAACLATWGGLARAATGAAVAAPDLGSAYRDPDVDGRPLERVWDRATVVPPFLDVSTGLPDAGAEARLLSGPRALSVLFILRSAGRPAGVPDGELADDVRVEVQAPARSLAFHVDALGRTWADAGGGGSAIPPLSWAGAVHGEGRTRWAEIALPWSLLDVAPGGALAIKLSRARTVAVSERTVRRVSVSGGGRGHRDDRVGFRGVTRPVATPPPPGASIVRLAAPGPEPLGEVPVDDGATMPLLCGDRWAAFAMAHAPDGGDATTLRVEGAGQGVDAELLVAPRWLQAGTGDFVEAVDPEGTGDVWVRELLLKDPRARTAPAAGAPVVLPLAPDHPELLVLRVRVSPSADPGPRTLVVSAAPGSGLPSLAIAVDVLDAPAPVPRQRHGAYMGRPTARDLELARESGLTELVLDPRGLAPGARALALAGESSLTLAAPPEAASGFDPSRTLVYGVDEPFTRDDHDRCREIFRLARQRSLRTATALTSRRSLATLAPLLDRAILNVALVPGLGPREPGGPERYAYWQLLREDALRHRLLGGLSLWANDLDGAIPYAWMDGAGDPWDDWDGGGMRDHVAVYPAGEDRIPTIQLLGLEMGMGDLRVAAALDAWLLDARRAPAGEVEQARELRDGMRQRFAAPYWEVLGSLDHLELDRWRREALALTRGAGTGSR